MAGIAFALSWIALAGRGLWTAVGPRSAGNFLMLAAAPTTPSTIYAATSTLLFRSSDAGKTWAALPVPPAVTALLADPRSPTTVYAGTSFSGGIFDPEDGAVYRSSDGGSHWNAATSGIRSSVLSLALDPATGALYCGTSAGAFGSSDNGASWSPVGSTLAITRVQALAIESTRRPARIYAAGDPGVYASDDGGESWRLSGTGLTSVMAIAVDPRPAGIVYAGTNGGGVFRSLDRGGTWRSVSAGLSNLQVFAMAMDPSDPSALYVATNAGIFRTGNGASQWTEVDEGLPSLFAAALVVDPDVPGSVYAAVLGPGLFQRSFATRAPRWVGFR